MKSDIWSPSMKQIASLLVGQKTKTSYLPIIIEETQKFIVKWIEVQNVYQDTNIKVSYHKLLNPTSVTLMLSDYQNLAYAAVTWARKINGDFEMYKVKKASHRETIETTMETDLEYCEISTTVPEYIPEEN